MSDSYREVTRVSWFGRLRQSVIGVLIGLVVLLVAVIGLFWNEGRAVTTARSLAEGAGVVVSIGADAVDPANEGRLVHVTGRVTTTQEPVDAAFGINAPGIRLERRVEMYQWIENRASETKTKLGGGEETVTTYSYARQWSSSPVDSSGFKVPAGHANPPMAYRSQDFQISEGRVGVFVLDAQVLSRIGGAEVAPISAALLPAIRQSYSGSLPLIIADGRIYLGADPATPAIGDYRVAYEVVPLGSISVVARQTGQSFSPYQTEAGDRLLMVESGAVPAQQMFADAVAGNTVLTWVLRAVGLIALVVAFSLLLGPLGTIADVIPLLGRIVRMGTGAVAFALAVLVGCVTIAIAWFWYRPLLSLAIIAVGVAVVWVIGRLGGRGDAASTKTARST